MGIDRVQALHVISYTFTCFNCKASYGGSNFNEFYAKAAVKYPDGSVFYHCECGQEMIVIPPENKYKQSLQGILDAVRQIEDYGNNKISLIMWEKIDQARKVMEGNL